MEIVDSTNPSTVPSKQEKAPAMMTVKELDSFALKMPSHLTQALGDLNGKPNPDVSFEAELVFRHVIAPVLESGFLTRADIRNLDKATPLVGIYQSIKRDYGTTDPSKIRGYAMYENFRDETDFNKERIRLSSAALFHLNFDVESLVRYIGGPHVGEHRSIPAIRKRLEKGVDPEVLNHLLHGFEYGAPKKVKGYSSNDNFMQYKRYGNHSSVDDHPEEHKKVMVKDSKRGNTILLDKRLLMFIPHLHLTPQGLADLYNKWKNSRSVYDSSFRPELWCEGINDWVNTITEGDVTFPGSFKRFLAWIWNLRITYPDLPIFLGDDDVKNAFRLIKSNPAVVSMHGFTGAGLLGLCTGMTFGDNYSPANFDHASVARSQQAVWLWEHEPTQTLAACQHHIDQLELQVDPNDDRPFGQANKDSQNPGALRDDGSRIPPSYVSHVDDHLYADVAEKLPLTIAASVESLTQVFGGNHPCQEPVLSDEKLHLVYQELRTLLGHEPDSRSMTVRISPRRKEKLINFMHEEGWTPYNVTRKTATIKEIAQLIGMIQSACEYFHWGLAQLLVLQELLRNAIATGFRRAKQNQRRQQKVADTRRRIPQEWSFRLKFLEERSVALFMWQSMSPISISAAVIRTICIIYDYLKNDLPWEMPIGHIVPRDYAVVSWGDASHHAIGVYIPCLKAWCLVPFSKHLVHRIKVKEEVHINVLEFLALFIAFLMFQTKYDADPSKFPPTPTMLSYGDSKSANSWMRKKSTRSLMGQNALRLFANYMLLSQVSSTTDHVKGIDNVEADDISRVQELFSPKKSHIYDVPFSTLIQQVCQKYNNLKSWEIFLPSPEILSDLSYVLSSDYLTEVPKRRKHFGHFYHVESTFYGSATNVNSSLGSFL
jgi:hypothetical protein